MTPLEMRIAQRKNAVKAMIFASVNQNSASPSTCTPRRAKPRKRNLEGGLLERKFCKGVDDEPEN